MTDLKERLRAKRQWVGILGSISPTGVPDPDCTEAADHIAALEAEVERLREALKPFVAAHTRLKSYSETRPDDSARLYVEEDGTLYELLNGEYGRPLVLGDFRRAREALKEAS